MNKQRFPREQDFTNDDMPPLTGEDRDTCRLVASNGWYFTTPLEQRLA